MVTNEPDSNGNMELGGPLIIVARELLNRLNVSYNITIFDQTVYLTEDGHWTGVFERLMEWVRLYFQPASIS